jgi:serralysin
MRAIQGRDSHSSNLASSNLAFEFGNRNFANDMFLTDFGAAKVFARPAAITSPGPHALIDTVPGDTSTTAVLTVGAPPIVSAIDAIADNDFYKIELIAGHEYQIGMFGYTPSGPNDPVGPTGAPLLDSFIELYDSAGHLITSADGGSDTTLNSANSGFDALLTFTATTSGTYYVDARAFDNIPVDGDRGDMVGDYGLFAKDVTDDNSVYTPYYDANSPLYAIDWGTQVNKVNQSARNPDGNEGTRDTGNAQGTPTYGSGLDMNALLAANGKTLADIAGKNVVTIYFAKAGEVITSAEDPSNPGLPPAAIETSDVSDFEHNAVMTALHQFEKVADVVYLEVQSNDQADFEYASYKGTPGPGISLLGSMEPPDEPNEGLALFNSGDYRWNATDLQQGGFSFVTLIHEIGHGHGLAHPHDNGGHSGIMHGVEPEGAGVADYTTGDFDLNQGIFTMMSYEDGWQTSPYGNAPTTGGYGYLGGLMAFDIAAIQDKYGVNENWATGNDTYVIKDVNAPGTFYTSIWDAGGNDTIVYSGARDANIDLRPATLQYEYGGGGWVSYAYGIYGGYTIANGVTIENATGGSGNDTLTGNDVANILIGGAGADLMKGGLGNDMYLADSADTIVEQGGQGTHDIVFVTANYTLAAGVDAEALAANDLSSTNAMTLIGNEVSQLIYGNAGADILIGGGGNDTMIGGAGNDIYQVDSAADGIIEAAGQGIDSVYATTSYTLTAGAEVELLSANDQASTSAISLAGNGLSQIVIGNAGADVLDGGGGGDTLYGLAGNDMYLVHGASDTIVEAAGQGVDLVFTTASYTLTAAAEVELLSANDQAGTGALNLTGNGFSQIVIGNAGANVIDGGAGGDSLYGLGGADSFAFTTALGASNVDHIADFGTGADKIALDDAVFTAVGGLGGLNANAFFAGTAAHDADDRIIYDAATGNLYYDADGNGAGAQVLFAVLDNHATLAASDFQVI